jgi:hypothetical protein
MIWEKETTDELLRVYKAACRNLAESVPGTRSAANQMWTVQTLFAELQARSRSVGLLKSAPLVGRKHQKPAFPSKS